MTALAKLLKADIKIVKVWSFIKHLTRCNIKQPAPNQDLPVPLQVNDKWKYGMLYYSNHKNKQIKQKKWQQSSGF